MIAVNKLEAGNEPTNFRPILLLPEVAVKSGNAKFDSKSVTCGVPQGSTLMTGNLYSLHK